MKLQRFFLIFIGVIALCISPAMAQLKNENLLFTVPKGYVQGFATRQNNMQIVEWVPRGQNVQNWREMVTLQIHFGTRNNNPKTFAKRFAKGIKTACKGSQLDIIREGRERGYRFILFAVVCPLNPATKKPEWIMVKAISGRDSFYTVQKAWRYNPTAKDIPKWTRFLRKIEVCDSRVAAARCP